MPQSPLLITASLDPGKTAHVALSGIRERAVKHMEGFLAWCRDPFVGKIVFVKNCGASIRPELLVKTASDHGKELEFLQVASSPRTAVQGKGFGEGDLVRQALERSEVLRDAESFVKITGKLYSPGIAGVFDGKSDGEFYLAQTDEVPGNPLFHRALRRIYSLEAGSSAMGFLRRRFRVPWGMIAPRSPGWIDTRFYRISTAFYRTRLLDSHRRVQDALGYTLEKAFYNDLRESTTIRFMGDSPVILGTSGTLGTTAAGFAPEIQ